MLLGTILDRNKKIIMEDPTYLTAYYDFLHMGFQVKTVGQDGSGLNVMELEHTDGEIVYVMPSHQFPMGTVMPLSRRMELLSWAGKQEGRYIIEDDYDSEFRYKGKPIPALKGFDNHDCVIYMGTFSKSLAPSIRVSYMVLPVKLMKQYQNQKHPFSVTVSRVDQKILELFLQEGYYQRHLNKMRGIYKSKHDFLLKYLKEEMAEICQVSGEYAGVHLVLCLLQWADRTGSSDKSKKGWNPGIWTVRILHFRESQNISKSPSGLCLYERKRTFTGHKNLKKSLGKK